MKGLLLALVASITALGLYYTLREPPVAMDMYKDRSTLNEICDLMEWDCSQVEEPTVVITKLVDDRYYGLYFPGERYIFVAHGSDLPYRHIEIHETVHYIQYELRHEVTRCDSERLAREVTAALTDTEVHPTWEERYGCTGI